jgi:hypothetical protein
MNREDLAAFKVGTRIRVTYVGDYVGGSVAQNLSDDGDLYLIPKDAEIEILPDPLKVGDILNGDSPEPPMGTVLLDQWGFPWQRPPLQSHWRSYAYTENYTWSKDSLHQNLERTPLTVLYVPEVQR